MKASVLQENLQKAVTAAARCIASQPQLPVLANILLRAEKGRLLVMGTDLSVTVGLLIGGKVEKEGAITVPARDFSALVSGLAAGRVELLVKEAKLEIKAGRTKAKLLAIKAEEFPEIGGEVKKSFSVAKDALVKVVERTQFCVSIDEGRPLLAGVKIEKRGGGLRLTATDGYRLSLAELKEVEGSLAELGGSIVVPGRILSETGRLISNELEEGKKLGVGFTKDGEIRFEFEGGWVMGKLLAGEFPAVDQILPKETEVKVAVDREELEKAVRVAAIFARESANIIKFKISAKGGQAKLKIMANSPQIGENETVVEVELKSKEPSGEIAFNSRYLLDFLGAVGGEARVRFEMTEALKPGVFMVEGDDSFRHVIMPVRVQR